MSDPLHNHDGDEPPKRESRGERDVREVGEDRTSRATGIERHVHSLLLAIITAAVLYLGNFVLSSRDASVEYRLQIASQVAAFASLSNEVAALRAQISSMQLSAVGRDEWRDHEARLRTIEANERQYRPDRR